MIRINLEFDKTLTSLAGNQFGKSEFNKQIQNVQYEDCYELSFPDRIQNMATSFIQGFFQEFVRCFGISGIEEKVEIKSTIPNLKQFIIDCLV